MVTALSRLKSTSAELKAKIISWTRSYLVNRMQGEIIVGTRKCVFTVVCVKLGKLYVVKHNCVT